MNTFLVSYDLNSPGKDYSKLIDKIKSISNIWWHHLDSCWVIRSEASVASIRDTLAPFIDKNDELLVMQSSGVAAWTGFNLEGSTWLKDNL
jgi:hypothetical protein